MNINSVSLIGHLTRDPESFSAGCNLGLAVNERAKENGEWTDRASFFDITVFGKQAEACVEHLSKGSQVGVNGRLTQDRWEKDGEKRSKVKIIAFAVQFLGGKDKPVESDVSADETDLQPVGAGSHDPDSDIPFARPVLPEFGTERMTWGRPQWGRNTL